MITNRELTMDDYSAMLRRRLKMILIPALVAPLIGFLISFALTPKYTSQSLILVEDQKVPVGYVKPVVTEDLTQRIATIQQQVLSRNRLQPMIERLGLAKGGRSVDDVIDDIRLNLSVQPVAPTFVDPTAAKKKPGQGSDVPGFYVQYTANNPREAQQICGALTSMMLEENLKAREQVAQSTNDFLSHQIEEAKRDLNDQDRKLAEFKKQYMGQLPGDSDNNLKLLMGLNSQLDANTQTLNRAQQDKTYTESLLSQQLATWKSSQSSTNPTTLEQQLASLQAQLMSLQSRYTDDHPDVVKTKADIAEVKRQLKAANAASPETVNDDKAGMAEPPEIRQLRMQVHQYDAAITQATREQKRLQDEIRNYQGKVALSPGIEEQYKLLTRDYDSAEKFYNDLLAKKSESEMQTDMERRQQGEQMRLLNPANLPDAPSFPNRLLFAGGGLAAGLGIGVALALFLELRDKSIRTEQDVEAILNIPTLVSLPWLGADGAKGSGPKRNPSEREHDEQKETVGV